MTGPAFEFEDFRFQPSTRELWRAGRRVELPRRTFECLDYLIVHRERAVGRDELVEAVFGRPDVSDAQLGQTVLRARRVVDDDGNTQRAIRTIAGFGYRWIAETRVADLRGNDAAAPAAIDAAGPGEVVLPGPVPRPAAAARRRIAAVVAIAIVAVLAWSGLRVYLRPVEWAPQSAPAMAADHLVVLPIQVDGLREDAWVRLGAMDLVAERLREAGFSVPPSENVLGMLQAAPRTHGEIDIASLRRITAAGMIVRGDAVRDASGWRVELAATPEHGIAVPVAFSARDAMQAARGASDLLLAALGHAQSAAGEREAPSDETLQRARAAMLANELDTARTILISSPQFAADADQLAYRLAQIDVRAGRLDHAEAALDAVLAHPAVLADPRFRAQLLTARGATRTRRGAFADGGRDFDAALTLLGVGGDALSRGQARLGRANSRVAEHRFDEALADFGLARGELESAGDMLGVARVDANLGVLELYRGRPAAALGYLPGAADRFETFGALHEMLLTLTGLVEAQLAMLQRDAAWQTVERAIALRERITDPDQRVDLLMNRAQVLIGFGRYHEAQAALSQASRSATSGNRVLLARLGSLRADLAARLGHWQEADAAAGAALADWPAAGADGDRAEVVLVRQRALLGLGRDNEAAQLLDRSRAVPATASDVPGRVADALAMAEWAQQNGDATQAARWFLFAAATADHRGVPAEIVAVAVARAPRLLDAGARDAAAASIGRVASWAAHDFDCALLQVRLFHALGQREPWFNALRQAQGLAGEREIAPELLSLPVAGGSTPGLTGNP